MTVAAKFQNKGSIGNVEKKSKAIADFLNPNSKESNNIGTVPFYSSGARSYIRVGGVAVGVCTSITWSVKYQSTPINTIDTLFPWEIDTGSCIITASLQNIIDPTAGPEFHGFLPIMASAGHQPTVEIQVLDASGTSLFWAKGVFLSISCSVTKGALSTMSCDFMGLGYQHYTAQSFKPYNAISSGASALTGKLKSLTSGLSGGIL